jgi:hypothetical protein
VAIAKARRDAFSQRIRVGDWPHPHGYRNWDICGMAELIDVPAERRAIAEFAAALPESTRWKPALTAAANGDHARAAKVFDEVGSPTLAARAHALAAFQDQDGRSQDAARHLDLALGFFATVGAKRLADVTAARARKVTAP